MNHHVGHLAYNTEEEDPSQQLQLGGDVDADFFGDMDIHGNLLPAPSVEPAQWQHQVMGLPTADETTVAAIIQRMPHDFPRRRWAVDNPRQQIAHLTTDATKGHQDPY